MSQTRRSEPSLVYKVRFSLRKIKQMIKCQWKLSSAGVPNITLGENIMVTPINALAFVIIHPQISKRRNKDDSSRDVVYTFIKKK